jgi:DnaJ-class molecular chaperone
VTLLLLLASSLLLVFAGRYAWRCWAHPFAPCRRCSGTGKRTTRLLRRTAVCGRCQGHGHRVRLGRRLHTRARRLHHDGTR